MEFGFRKKGMKKMKKNSLVLLLILISFNCSFGQSPKCEVLKALLQHKGAEKLWLLDEYPNTPIVFVDLKHFFRLVQRATIITERLK